MTYPEPDRTYGEEPRFLGEGFRVEPDFRQASGSPERYDESDDPTTARYAPLGAQGTESASRRAVTAAELDDAFDNPEHGEPGRDRLAVHWLWELVLLLACAGLAFAVQRKHAGALSGANLRDLMVSATILGLVALGAGLTLRAGAVNLAIGPTMVASALYFGAHADDGFLSAAGIALLIALACGATVALAVVVLHVPGWAASLAAFFGIQVWIAHLPATVTLTDRYHPNAQGYYWFGGFALLAVLGGVLGAIRPVRRAVGRFRPVGDPADRRGTSAAVLTGLAIVASGLLAGVAGIASTMQEGGFASQDGLFVSGTAVAVALLGGTSAYGRRGGIFGTLLATAAFALVIDFVTIASWRVSQVELIAVALGLGVLVTRLVEATGRPRRSVGVVEDDTGSWLGRQQGSWANQPPERVPIEAAWVDASDERWGAQ